MTKVIDNWKKSWKFLKESKNYLIFIAILFLASLLLGLILPIFFQEMIMNFIKQVVIQTKDLNFLQLFFFILQNNLLTAFSGLILGVVFGIIPVFFTILNGYVLGFVMNKVAYVDILSVFKVLPYGIFELSAVIISLALGLRLGMFIFRKRKNKKVFYSDMENYFRIFLFIVIPLLVVAALIEAGLIILLE